MTDDLAVKAGRKVVAAAGIDTENSIEVGWAIAGAREAIAMLSASCKRCGGSGELSGYSQPGADNGPCPDCNGTGQAMLSADSVVVPRELLGKLMANADMHPMGHWATMQLIGKDFLDLRDLYNAALAAKGGE